MYFIGMNVPLGIRVPFGIYLNDLTQMAYPPRNMFNPFLKAFKNHQTKEMTGQAKYIFVPLPSLIRDAVEFLWVQEERIVLNAPGFSPIIPGAKDTLSMEREVTKVRQKYNIPKEYLLVMGNVDERNNVTKLVGILKELHRQGQDLDLVIYGQENTAFYTFRNELIQAGVQQRVHILPSLETDEIPYLIAGSQCIVHSAFYEWFCELLLQAVYQEKPIVASNIAGIRELLGQDGFISFYPASTPSIQKAILQGLTDASLGVQTNLFAQKKLPNYIWERHFETFQKTILAKN